MTAVVKLVREPPLPIRVDESGAVLVGWAVRLTIEARREGRRCTSTAAAGVSLLALAPLVAASDAASGVGSLGAASEA